MKIGLKNFNLVSYEKRKKDHIRLALKSENKAEGLSGLEQIKLIHEPLPEMNFSDVDLSAFILGKKRRTPFFVSPMTGGHDEAPAINFKIARACTERGWMMGAGSQRKQLTDPLAKKEWAEIRKQNPDLFLIGNLGLSQLIESSVQKIEELVQSFSASAMMIHLNVLQECLQPEGTPRFKGGIDALERAAKKLSVPLLVKETGCGFSRSAFELLQKTGIQAVDVSGLGGTHWGRIEGRRAEGLKKKAAETFSHWGNSTLSSLIAGESLKGRNFEMWSSGGLQNGLDAAKSLALGASACGFGSLILESALLGEKELDQRMALIEEELKIALFCTGSPHIASLKGRFEPLK